MEHEQVFIAPWSNIEELKEVYKNIFSKNYPEKQIALEQICVWRTRCYPALPTAVEATDLLTRAMVQDMIHQAEKGNISKKDITMMYCTAIVRQKCLNILWMCGMRLLTHSVHPWIFSVQLPNHHWLTLKKPSGKSSLIIVSQ
ncbi:unnamed protein product [Larinioides sclopetarius]|uniref:Uncharacterized protein n=1 Tax=Larinioides sclopetarius TaxID=280406 RepID=A0AAV2AN52_9ARAC